MIRKLPITGLTTWAAPYTGDFECVIPEGTILKCDSDQAPGSIAFGATPVNYKELESSLVPADIRLKPKYSGYYFSIENDIINVYLSLVGE